MTPGLQHRLRQGLRTWAAKGINIVVTTAILVVILILAATSWLLEAFE